ncbi:hypothetical protein HK096_005458 [Nowakowskiella sp. JEL0078]|nr:hypothetical protein HK096_005458 [Nowakowskiella sp. JEL0078]
MTVLKSDLTRNLLKEYNSNKPSCEDLKPTTTLPIFVFTTLQAASNQIKEASRTFPLPSLAQKPSGSHDVVEDSEVKENIEEEPNTISTSNVFFKSCQLQDITSPIKVVFLLLKHINFGNVRYYGFFLEFDMLPMSSMASLGTGEFLKEGV